MLGEGGVVALGVGALELAGALGGGPTLTEGAGAAEGAGGAISAVQPSG